MLNLGDRAPSSAIRVTDAQMTGGPQPVEESADPGHVRWLAILTAVVIFSLWVLPLFSSFWLDELGTWWVVKDGAGDTIHRALTFHGQSPLYYLISGRPAYMGGRFGAGPASALAHRGRRSAILLYRLARTLISREAARLTVLAFAATRRSRSRRRRRGRTRSRPW